MTRTITLIPVTPTLHEDARAGAIVAALEKVLASGQVTPDLGGTATTTSFADAICHTLSSA